MRKDIEFDADGVTLRGWLYAPEREDPAPAIVMAHGFSSVKELYLDDFAEVFAAAGFAVLVYDNRNFGASDGEPRQEIDPVAQGRDYRHAISFAALQPEINADRIGIWGSSYSGGHVLAIAAVEPRVKCAVAQVPHIDGPAASVRWMPGHIAPALRGAIEMDRASRFNGGAPMTIPVVAEGEASQKALGGEESYRFFIEGQKTRAPAWRNEITLRSVEWAMEYDPAAQIHRIGPTPLMMIVAKDDTVTPTDLALDAFARAREPKRLVLMDGGHFDPYQAGFAEASSAARDWFVEHLKP